LDIEATTQSPFEDISTLAEETQAEIDAAYEAKLIKGTSETTFQPYKPITRSQMALMIKRAYEYKTKSEYTSEVETPFTDLETLGDEAQTSIQLAYSLGLIKGYGDMYKPYNNATREQSAKVLSLFLKSGI
jgi:5'-nucleotidase